jgi:hypothetical protein
MGSSPDSIGCPRSQLLQETQTSDQLLEGVKLGDQIYKNHLDRYNQLDLLLGKAPSARHELFYFGGPNWARSGSMK